MLKKISKMLLVVLMLLVMLPANIFAEESQSDDKDYIVLDFEYYSVETDKTLEEYEVSMTRSNESVEYTLTNKETGEVETFTDRPSENSSLTRVGTYAERTLVHNYSISIFNLQSAINVTIYSAGGSFVQINSVNGKTISLLSVYGEIQSQSTGVSSATGKFPTSKINVSAYCVVQIPINIAGSLGFDKKLIEGGFQISGNLYYRKAHTEQYSVSVPY